jgi:hypothetical protein
MKPALVANWRVWFPAQAVNFTLIPEEQRILYGNIVGILWTIIISNMQQQQQQPEPMTAETTTAIGGDTWLRQAGAKGFNQNNMSGLSGLRRVSSSSPA